MNHLIKSAKDHSQANQPIDLKTIVVILLKESVLKLLYHVAPNLYKHRFHEDIVLSVACDYIEGKQNKKVDNFIKEITEYDSDQ